MRKPVVVRSTNAADGVHCIDLRRTGEGAFEAALCRRDPEDPHGWRILQVESLQGAETEKAAHVAALTVFGWSVAD